MEQAKSKISDEEYERRKKILEAIRQFSRTEQEEVYRILRRNNESISENRNGIFFDLVVLKDSTIHDIEEWFKFCERNNAEFSKRSEELEALHVTE